MTTATTTTNFATLSECLHHFQSTFNDNSRVKKLIKNWERSIIVEATDTNATLTMVISDLIMTDVKEGAHPDEDNPIHLQAAQDVLIRVFSGDYNPAHALIDGELAVFSSEKDKVKLEAITMVIWGM
jgi:putative sterol carrier protein